MIPKFKFLYLIKQNKVNDVNVIGHCLRSFKQAMYPEIYLTETTFCNKQKCTFTHLIPEGFSARRTWWELALLWSDILAVQLFVKMCSSVSLHQWEERTTIITQCILSTFVNLDVVYVSLVSNLTRLELKSEKRLKFSNLKLLCTVALSFTDQVNVLSSDKRYIST